MREILKRFILFIAGFFLFLSSCTKTNNTDSSTVVPNVTVSLSLNINTSAYTSLTPIGGVAYLTNVGYRGILLYRLSAGTIMAYDRTCTYDLPDAGGIVYAQTNGTAICVDCGSAYNLNNGSVNAGPTTIGLKVYNASLNTSTGILTITN
jgi:nitrite reductase/ring-hydroxylating ferredoxin subunit